MDMDKRFSSATYLRWVDLLMRPIQRSRSLGCRAAFLGLLEGSKTAFKGEILVVRWIGIHF
jgi:hypothetical protein